ncbi:LysE family transporter [Paenibacillus swuensis]|uniref:LysE family transporter n=1 Tax=Paenibacillus swuensis TaxID=1178515 RepID=UPI002F907228
MPEIKLTMSLCGSLYMVYLAIQIMRSTLKEKDPEDEGRNSFFSGVMLQFMNPKGILYALTVASTFIIPFYKSSISLVMFAVLLAVVTFLSNTCWAIFGFVFRKFLSKYERPFNYTMGILLIYGAVSIYF